MNKYIKFQLETELEIAAENIDGSKTENIYFINPFFINYRKHIPKLSSLLRLFSFYMSHKKTNDWK